MSKANTVEDNLCEGFVAGFLSQVQDEYVRARGIFPKMNAAHEGYGVIQEEFDELWELIKKKRTRKNEVKMRCECIQIAAMVMAFYLEVT